jgi:RNA polymerase sigma factor (sigma-70 family)
MPRVNYFHIHQNLTERRSPVPREAATNYARLADGEAGPQRVVLPHLDDVYELARWLTDNRTDAEEVVKEVCLRAFRGIGNRSTSHARTWMLASAHRVAYDRLQKRRPAALNPVEDLEDAEAARLSGLDTATAETASIAFADVTQLKAAIAALPALYRETILLRDILGLSYREIVEVTGEPTGVVARRLAHARNKLVVTLRDPAGSRQEPSCAI